jgi:hypothetical protein
MNQGFKVLVFLAFGYLIFNVPLVGDIAKFFWYLIQLVGTAVWIIFKAALENKPEDREHLIFFTFIFVLLVGVFRMRR